MGPLGDDQDPLSPDPATEPQPGRRSRLDPVALAAAAEADQIPVDRRWSPAWTLLLLIGVPTLFWAVIWFAFFR